MTTPLLNRDRLVKLVALAESSNDNEALSAIRKAAALARAAGLSLGMAVSNNPSNTDAAATFRAAMAEASLASARRRIADLEQQISAGASEDQMEAAHAKGYQRGHAAGRSEMENEARMEASRRIREVEAELEAYKPTLDWVAIAENFAFKNQRGLKAIYAKAVLLRARTNKLTPNDQAELRKFSEKPKRGGKAKAAESPNKSRPESPPEQLSDCKQSPDEPFSEINRAYNRGLADGRAGVDLGAKPHPLRRKRA